MPKVSPPKGGTGAVVAKTGKGAVEQQLLFALWDQEKAIDQSSDRMEGLEDAVLLLEKAVGFLTDELEQLRKVLTDLRDAKWKEAAT